MLTYIPGSPRCGVWIGPNLRKGAALQIFLKWRRSPLMEGAAKHPSVLNRSVRLASLASRTLYNEIRHVSSDLTLLF